MRGFELLEPSTLDEAVTLLDREDESIRAIAGGTALMLMMKARLFQPTRLVSLRRVNGPVKSISLGKDGALRIGAMTPLQQMESSGDIARAFPVMTRTLHTLSNIRIRNVATLGGHLAHGDPHMDLPPVLVTLGARVRAVSPRGQRWIPVEELIVGYYQTALERDELIAEVEIPAQPDGVHAWYEKFTALSADDWPAVGVAVWYRIASGVIAEARVAISSATERPMRSPGAESVLAKARPTTEIFMNASDAAAAEVQPLADIRGTVAYKREMIRVHVRRALQNALQTDHKEGK